MAMTLWTPPVLCFGDPLRIISCAGSGKKPAFASPVCSACGCEISRRCLLTFVCFVWFF